MLLTLPLGVWKLFTSLFQNERLEVAINSEVIYLRSLVCHLYNGNKQTVIESILFINYGLFSFFLTLFSIDQIK